MSRSFKNTLLAAVAVTVLMPGIAVHAEGAKGDRWAGAYGGLVGGYAFGDAPFTYQKLSNGAVKCTKPSKLFKDCPSGKADLEGGFGGVTIGYNMPVTDIVLGVEADFIFGDMGGKYDSGIVYSKPSKLSKARVNSYNVDLDIAGTVRGRIGMPMGDMGQTLVFLTGGFAWADYNGKFKQDKYKCGSDGSNCVLSKTSKMAKDSGLLFGVALGGGVEHAIDENWSVKVEYLYTSYRAGTKTVVANSKGTKFGLFTTDLDLHMVRAGVNMAF